MKELERDRIKKILETCLEGAGKYLQTIWRMNQRQAAAAEGKPRLLVVVLGTSNQRNEVLLTSKNLRKSTDWRDVWVTPDLTKAQEAREKDKWRQVQRLNNELDEAGDNSGKRWRLAGKPWDPKNLVLAPDRRPAHKRQAELNGIEPTREEA